MSANVQLVILTVNHAQQSGGEIPVQFLNTEAQSHISLTLLSVFFFLSFFLCQHFSVFILHWAATIKL
ncbi:hypothetical protein EXN66_Car022124 [Channa argus]|uniref:Uncharacterized protein n=1 Tax=Channa argus TaxID=215402 RepID=A0A6G1QV06_CHAAH|nr:hypothetical protein EXN66_Car022124 [Channa argus]